MATADDLDESKGQQQQHEQLERVVGMDEDEKTDGKEEVDEDAVESDSKSRVQYRPVASDRSKRYAFEPECTSENQQDKEEATKRLARAAATRDQALDQTRQTRALDEVRQRLLGASAETTADAEDVEMIDQSGGLFFLCKYMIIMG